jgi:3-deoxy-D-manno-octulosonate 8-phosphate phosphatase (KDO 8-P phosphatase)
MSNLSISNVIFDVDGVLTDGTFFYSIDGKILKRFGSHDAQAIKRCSVFFNLQLISADKKGFEISKLRAEHLGLPITLVPEDLRSDWISNHFIREETALVVDSFTDIPSLRYVVRSFAPRNAHPELLNRVSNVLNATGGGGAVAEVLDILLYEKFQKHLWDI